MVLIIIRTTSTTITATTMTIHIIYIVCHIICKITVLHNLFPGFNHCITFRVHLAHLAYCMHKTIVFTCYFPILQPVGFMESPIPYSSVEDVNIVSRWDAGQKFCIRITIPDGSVLLQVCMAL